MRPKVILLLAALCLSSLLHAQTASDFRQAAEQGDAKAQYNLGICYYKGRGVAQDYAEAAQWWRKAAEQGYAPAQLNLGSCYSDGRGAAIDKNTALYWLEKALLNIENIQEDLRAPLRTMVEDLKAQGYSSSRARVDSGSGSGSSMTSTSLALTVSDYRQAAEQGDAEAQYNLGFCYENGYGITQDYAEAVRWYRKAAEQGNAPAQVYLGICYYKGRGVAANKNTALYWLEKALVKKKDLLREESDLAELTVEDLKAQVYSTSRTRVGSGSLGTSPSPDRMESDMHRAAEQGYADAQFDLGFCYYHGEGVAQDYAEAVWWYRKAAEQGYAKAQCNLGVCYDYGKGVARDYAEAVRWYRKAAESGNAEAQYNLGLCHEQGEGVARDYAEATRWYHRAAEQGNAEAQYNLGFCYQDGYGVAVNKNIALYWFEKALVNIEDIQQDLHARLRERVAALREAGYSSSHEWVGSDFGSSRAAIPVKRKAITGKVEKIWVDYNVTEGGKKGMKIHVKYSVQNMRGMEGMCAAYFYYENGVALNGSRGWYGPAGGQVSVGENFTPDNQNTNSQLSLFIPYKELYLPPGRQHKLKFRIALFEFPSGKWRRITFSDYYRFKIR